MPRNRLTAFVTGLLLIGAAPLLDATPAHAATTQHVVTTTADVVDSGDGQLSLREAVTAASADPAQSEIVLAAGATYHLSICDNGVWEHENLSGDLDVASHTSTLTITGNGARIEQDCADQRVLLTFRDLTVRHLTIAGADVVGATAQGEDDGAGLYVWSPAHLRVEDSTFTDLHAVSGTASYAGGTVELVRTTITGNTATTGTAGVVLTDPSATLSVEDSLIAGNDTNSTSVIFSSSAGVDIRNSTIVDNHGGAISSIYASTVYAHGALTVDHVTMVGNTQPGGGALYSGSSSVDVTSSILADDGPTTECNAESPTTTSGGGNVLRDASCGTPTATDQTGVADPGLGALGDNGGSTATMFPLAGSPALDAVPTADCDQTTDQRGLPRPSGTACDAGAVEVQHVPDGLIRRDTRAFVGNGIHNLNAAGQTRNAVASRGQVARFTVRVDNDGDVDDDFVVRGNLGRDTVTARYFVAGQDVSSSVAAGYPITLGAHERVTVGIRVRVAGNAPHGLRRSFTVGLRTDPGAVTDRVRATVQVA